MQNMSNMRSGFSAVTVLNKHTHIIYVYINIHISKYMYNIGLITIAIIIIIFTCSAFNLPTVLDTSLRCFTTWKLRYPLPGWTGEHDWQTFVAHQDLPNAFDPPGLWQPKNGWFSVVFYCFPWFSIVCHGFPWFL